MTRELVVVLAAAAGFGGAPSARAGAYFGAEANDVGQSIVYAGSESAGELFGSVFAARLHYTYQDAGRDVKVGSTLVTPTVGYRWTGPLTISVAVGPTWNDERKRGATEIETRTTEAFGQLGAYYWREGRSGEFLLSYRAKTHFFWSRLRASRSIGNEVSLGGELVRMGNDDFDYAGAGVLIERRWGGVAATAKLGILATGSKERGTYGGLEVYVPF